MSVVMDLLNSVTAIVTSGISAGDWITLGLIAVIAIAAGFMMQGMGSLVNTTVVALVVFGLALFVVGITKGGNAAALAEADWKALLAWQVHGLLAYAILFGVIIAVVQVIRSVVMR
ncbi:MAG: hypothetical protein HY243_03785 [Proteobacteria bacterium]|nr:hypothetical protein [Pseudomonadota bacterium]